MPLASPLLLASLLPLTLFWSVLWLLSLSFILPLALRPILLALRPCRLLLMLDDHWLWLLFLTLDCRAPLLGRRWRARALASLLLTLPRLRQRRMLLIVLSHYAFLRLVTVLVPEQRLLLLLSGISVSRILPLVNR